MIAEAPRPSGQGTPIEVRGAIAELFAALDDPHHYLRSETEILVDGGAGSGKTYGIILLLDQIAIRWPGTRIAIARQHKSRLAESVMVSMRKVLGNIRPYLFKGSDRGRFEYRYSNGSVIIPTGLDDPERQKSVEADIWYVNEVTECVQDNYTMILRSMRWGTCPWSFIVSDANPGPKFHWVNQRGKTIAGAPNPNGLMYRLLSRFKDNPAYWDEANECMTPAGENYYGTKLAQFRGVQYKRLVLNEWCSEEGLVWENYDPDTHLIDATCTKDDFGHWWIQWGEHKVGVRWFFASVDWGFRNPGTLQVWAVDGDERLYLVREHYHTEWLIDRWADIAEREHETFGFASIACDPAEPGDIAKFNDRLGTPGGRGVARLAREADNDVSPGLDQVRNGFEVDTSGKASLYLFRDSLAHAPDENLVQKARPTRVAAELEGYVWKIPPATKPDYIKDEPEKINDHGCDAMRYAAMYAWRRDETPPRPEPEFDPGSYGDILGHGRRLGGDRFRSDF